MDQPFNRLKKFRNYLELSQEAIAQKAGIRQAAYQGQENGRSKIQYYVIEACYKEGLNINWLVSGQGEMLRDSQQAEEIESECQTKLKESETNLKHCRELNAVYLARIGDLTEHVQTLRSVGNS